MAENFQWYLAERFQTRNLDEQARLAARELLQLGDQPFEAASGGLAVDRLFDEVADRFRIAIERVLPGEMHLTARLYSRPGGFAIKINQRLPQSSFRFLLAHEYAHLLAYDCSQNEPRRLFDNSRAEEQLCDRIARHLLLPEVMTGSDLAAVLVEANYLNDPLVLHRPAENWRVAPWQFLRRAIERSGRPDLVALFWQATAGTATEPAMSIVDHLAPLGVFVPRGDRTFLGRSTNQGVWEAKRRGRPAAFQDVFSTGTLQGTLRSLSIPSKSGATAIQLIWLDESHMNRIRKWQAANAIQSYPGSVGL